MSRVAACRPAVALDLPRADTSYGPQISTEMFPKGVLSEILDRVSGASIPNLVHVR